MRKNLSFKKKRSKKGGNGEKTGRFYKALTNKHLTIISRLNDCDGVTKKRINKPLSDGNKAMINPEELGNQADIEARLKELEENVYNPNATFNIKSFFESFFKCIRDFDKSYPIGENNGEMTTETYFNKIYNYGVQKLQEYIIEYNSYINSSFIKNIQNIRSSEKYNSDSKTKKQIDSDFKTLFKKEQGLDEYLDKYMKYKLNIIQITSILKLNKEDDIEKIKKDKLYLTLFSSKPAFQIYTSSGEKSEIIFDINEINELFMYFFSYKINKVYEAITSSKLDASPSEYSHILVPYITLVSYLLNIQIIKQQNENIKKFIEKEMHKFYYEYMSSDVISYVKIRDNMGADIMNNRGFNPRYLYGIDNTEIPITEFTTILQNVPLTLVYKNYEFETIGKGNDGKMLMKNIKDKSLQYDNLFQYGRFSKIIYNENNENFGNNMNEVIEKLKSDSNVFIIGYGASGAGKTTTLIYDGTDAAKDSNQTDGAVVYMLKNLVKFGNGATKFKSAKLTITEIFMSEEIGEGGNIKIEQIDKIKDVGISYNEESQTFIANTPINYTGELTAEPKYKDRLFGGDITTQKTLSEILKLLVDDKRKIDATSNNPQSSRSHVISTIKFGENGPCLFIGDFAGVENKFDITFNKQTVSEILGKSNEEIFNTTDEYTREKNERIKIDIINRFLNKPGIPSVISEFSKIRNVRKKPQEEGGERDYYYQYDNVNIENSDFEITNAGLITKKQKMAKYICETYGETYTKTDYDNLNYEKKEVKFPGFLIKPLRAERGKYFIQLLNYSSHVIIDDEEIKEDIKPLTGSDEDITQKVLVDKLLNDYIRPGPGTNRDYAIYILAKLQVGEKINMGTTIKPFSGDYSDFENEGNYISGNGDGLEGKKEKYLTELKTIFNLLSDSDDYSNVDTIEEFKTKVDASRYNYLKTLFNRINKNIKPKIDEAEKSVNKEEFYQAIYDRINFLHYQVIKRTYEGIFINKALEVMRNTMTNVLTNKAGNNTIVPNYVNKCINQYCDPVLGNCFSAIESESNNDEIYNTIHDVIIKKLNNTNQPTKMDTIISKLETNFTYCVCLVLNNSLYDYRGDPVNNPPKIPYIDLTDLIIEYNRYKRINTKLAIARGSDVPDPNNLIFKKFSGLKKRRGMRTGINGSDELYDKSFKDLIQKKTGYSYKNYINKDINTDILLLTAYKLYCAYAGTIKDIEDKDASYKNSPIHKNNIALQKLLDIKEYVTFLTQETDEKDVEELIEKFGKLIQTIKNINATSVVGTIDFIDEISKYNLNYDNCSIVNRFYVRNYNPEETQFFFINDNDKAFDYITTKLRYICDFNSDDFFNGAVSNKLNQENIFLDISNNIKPLTTILDEPIRLAKEKEEREKEEIRKAEIKNLKSEIPSVKIEIKEIEAEFQNVNNTLQKLASESYEIDYGIPVIGISVTRGQPYMKALNPNSDTIWEKISNKKTDFETLKERYDDIVKKYNESLTIYNNLIDRYRTINPNSTSKRHKFPSKKQLDLTLYNNYDIKFNYKFTDKSPSQQEKLTIDMTKELKEQEIINQIQNIHYTIEKKMLNDLRERRQKALQKKGKRSGGSKKNYTFKKKGLKRNTKKLRKTKKYNKI